MVCIIPAAFHFVIDSPSPRSEERQQYLELATDYENRALEAEKSAEDWFNMASRFDSITEAYWAFSAYAERKETIADEYRQEARHYRTLAGY
jgi:hypothetical protein